MRQKFLVRELLFNKRKTAHLVKKIVKINIELVEIEKRIHEIETELKLKVVRRPIDDPFVEYGVTKGDAVIVNKENAEEFRMVLGDSVTDFIKEKK